MMHDTFGLFDSYGLRHLPTHLVRAQRWDALEHILTDLGFIEAKCAATMAYDLVRDYTLAQEESKDRPPWEGLSKVEDFGTFVRNAIAVLDEFPELTFQLAANQPLPLAPSRVAEKRLESAPPSRPWLRLVNKERERPPKAIRNLRHTGEVRACAFAPTESLVASCGCNPHQSQDNLQLWDPETGQRIAAYSVPYASFVSFLPDSRLLALTGGHRMPPTVLEVRTGDILRQFPVLRRVSHYCRFSPNGEYLLDMGELHWDLAICDIRKGNVVDKLPGTEHHPWSGAIDAGATRVARGYHNGQIIVWDINSKAQLFDGRFGEGSIYQCTFTVDSKYLVAVVGEHDIVVVAVPSGHVVHRVHTEATLSIHKNTLALSPCGPYVATATMGERGVRIWNWQTGQVSAALSGFFDTVICCDFSSDASQLAVGGGEYLVGGWLCLWTPEIADSECHEHPFTAREENP